MTKIMNNNYIQCGTITTTNKKEFRMTSKKVQKTNVNKNKKDDNDNSKTERVEQNKIGKRKVLVGE